MLPRLIAEESLAAVTRTAIGSGVMKEEQQREVIQKWEQLAQAERPAAERQKLSRDQLKVMLAQSGIGVEWQTKN